MTSRYLISFDGKTFRYWEGPIPKIVMYPATHILMLPDHDTPRDQWLKTKYGVEPQNERILKAAHRIREKVMSRMVVARGSWKGINAD